MNTLKTLFLIFGVYSFSFGITPTKPQPSKKLKIINGSTVTNPALYPYQVLISGGDDGGGTLVSDKWILTAAHVASKSGLQFQAGIIDRTSTSGSQSRAYKQQRIHPDYSGGSHPNADIALIEVSSAFNLTGNVQTVKLASNNNSNLWAVNQYPTVIGFGRTIAGNSTLSNQLRQVQVQITSVNNTTNKIVAGGNGNNDSCQGDSGGPLLSGQTQIGIVSSGGGCGGGGDYAMVAKYLDFITQTIHLLGTPDHVCGATTFSNISKLPDGVTFQWSASPSNLFTVTSGSGLSFTTANSGPSGGQGTVTLTVNTPLGTYIHHKQVWVGGPNAITLTTDGTFSINGNSASICRNIGYCMTAKAGVTLSVSSNSPNTAINPLPSKDILTANSFSYSGWPMANSFFSTSTAITTNDKSCFGTGNAGSYFLTVNASNTCGQNSRGLIVQVNNCGYRAFPNPAQTTLSIAFENPELIESIPDLIEIQEEKSQKILKTKNIKAVKDKEKDNPKAYAKVEFDVGDLPRGTYYAQLTFSSKIKESVRIILN